MLSKKEREFIEDWLDVLDGRMTELDFFEKWASKRGAENLREAVLRIEEGESIDLKNYIRQMRRRLRKKYDKMIEDLKLLMKFMDVDYWP